MRLREDARADDVDPRWRMNNTAMALVRELLDHHGVLDRNAEGPLQRPGPSSGGWEDEERATNEAFVRWHAQERLRVEAANPETLLVPAVKFDSNNDWEVFPAEAHRIAAALDDVAVEDARAAVAAEQERDEEEGSAWGTAWGETPVEDLVQIAQGFAAYCERAARYGGFRVS
jgi:hypothetical protein